MSLYIDDDQLTAKIYVEEINVEMEEEDINKLIQEKGVIFGLENWKDKNWKNILIEHSELVIARGVPPVHGKDAKLVMEKSTDNTLNETDRQTFRDIAKIPMVDKEDIIAKVVPATEGKPGINIRQRPIRQRKGRALRYRAGKNVSFHDNEGLFKAEAAGQLSVGNQTIDVYPLYEINEELSLKTGNINFNGSVTIKGNVPTGYQVKAEGDITIYGIIEAAIIDAGGSVFVKEGIAGMEKAIIRANKDVEASYINQAEVIAGGNIKVRKSIMNSNCVAQGNIFCSQGVIIGGSVSSGEKIEVKDIGNVAHTKTELAFGVNKKVMEQVHELNRELEKLKENKLKLKILGDQLQQKKDSVGELATKERVMLLKQRNMYVKVSNQIQDINEELEHLRFEIGNYTNMALIVNGRSYENVEVTFGKYKRMLKQEYKKYHAYLENNEIRIQT